MEGIPGGGKFKGKGLEVGQLHLSWEWLLSRAGVVAEPWDPRLALRDVLRRLVFLGGALGEPRRVTHPPALGAPSGRRDLSGEMTEDPTF